MDKHYVYFVGCINPKTATLDAIKIGMSKNPIQRLQGMTTDNPFTCVMLSAIECETDTAALQLEQTYHLRFSDAKLTGEWFSITPELLTEIYQAKGHTHVVIDCELPKKSVALGETRQAILQLLLDAGEDGLQLKEIVEGMMGNKNSIPTTVRRMLKDGQIHQPLALGKYYFHNPEGVAEC